MILQTERLQLHTWRLQDAEDAHRIWGDPEVMRHIGVPHEDLARTRQGLARAMAVQQRHGVCLWKLTDRQTGATVGCCGFHVWDEQSLPGDHAPQLPAGARVLELAFHLTRPAWGRGLATEAARACLPYAFQTLNADAVVALVHPANRASMRVLQKLDFEPTGTDDGERAYVTLPVRRHPFDDKAADELLTFCSAAPATTFDDRLLRRLTTSLTSSSAGVVDLRQGPKRRLVAAVLDEPTNSLGTAVLVVLALRADAGHHPLAHRLLSAAESFVCAGKRDALEVPLGKAVRHLAPILKAAGYAHEYAIHQMTTRDGAPLPQPDSLPADLTWEDAAEPRLDAYHQTVAEAFADIPGSHLGPLDEFRQAILSAAIRDRLLIQNDRIAGFACAELTQDGVGVVSLIGRHPDFKGQNLGAHLLAESMRLTAERGATRFVLHAAATNETALKLYRTRGFTVTDIDPVYIKRLTEPHAP